MIKFQSKKIGKELITVFFDDEKLVFISNDCKAIEHYKTWFKTSPTFIEEIKPQIVLEEIEKYLTKSLKIFKINFELIGTEFQKTVWAELLKIKYGSVVSYSDIANNIGKPKATRAVANAIAKNPYLIIVPCHRVDTKNGKITGYRGGIEMKKSLQALETNNKYNK